MKWNSLAVENFLMHSLTDMPWQRKKRKNKNGSLAKIGSQFIQSIKASRRCQTFTHLFYKKTDETICTLAQKYGLSRQRIHQYINIVRQRGTEKIVRILMKSLTQKVLGKSLQAQSQNFTNEICNLKMMLTSLPLTIFDFFLKEKLIKKILTEKLSYCELCYMVEVREEHEDNLLHLLYNVFDSVNIAKSIPAEFIIPSKKLIQRIRFLTRIPYNKILTLGDIDDAYEEILLGHSIGAKKLSIINQALRQFAIK